MAGPVPTLLLRPEGSRDRNGVVTPTVSGGVIEVAGQYGRAWQVAEATTNYVVNPAPDPSGVIWYASAGARAFVDDVRSPTGRAMKLEASAGMSTVIFDIADAGFSLTSGSVTATLHAWVDRVGGWKRAFIYSKLNYSDGTTDTYTGGNFVYFDTEAGLQVQKMTWTAPVASGKTATALTFYVYAYPDTGMVPGDTLYLAGAQLEAKPYPTPYCDGSLGAGHAWTGTAHASASTRAAGVVTTPASSHITPYRGALLLRTSRRTDTGIVEPIVTVGTQEAGADWMQLRINPADQLELSWSVDGGAEHVVTASGTVPTDDLSHVYAEWDGTSIAVALGTDATVSGSRQPSSGSWGSSDLITLGPGT